MEKLQIEISRDELLELKHTNKVVYDLIMSKYMEPEKVSKISKRIPFKADSPQIYTNVNIVADKIGDEIAVNHLHLIAAITHKRSVVIELRPADVSLAIRICEELEVGGLEFARDAAAMADSYGFVYLHLFYRNITGYYCVPALTNPELDGEIPLHYDFQMEGFVLVGR